MGGAHLTGGFADPGRESQVVFRALLDAMARPCTVQPLRVDLAPPAPLFTAAGATVLALADADTPVFLDRALARSREVASWIRFHTAAPVVERSSQAALAVVSDGAEMPALEDFAQGSAEYPDRSATLVLQVASLDAGRGEMQFQGPGIARSCTLSAAGLPPGFSAMWSANNARFPLGVDMILAAPGAIAALPRSARLVATRASVQASESRACM